MPNADIPVSETDPHHWTYIAEGGATMVFSYDGPRSLRLSGTVIRLRKTHRFLSGPSIFPGELNKDPSVDFQEQVASRLIPPEFLPHFEHIQVEQGWLEAMANHHDEARPEKRRATDGIDVHRINAVLATNLVGGNGWAAEIKPKWGFKPNLAFLAPTSRSVKSRVCRFCMKKHTDQKARPDAYVPAHCPLELYSLDPLRVEKALCTLWDDWVRSKGTINMLRIFVNGKALDPDQESSAEMLAAELNPDYNSSYTLSSELRAKFAKTVTQILMDHPVLARLSEIQRSLDSLDIEGLSKLVTGKSAPQYPNELLPLLNAQEVREGVDPTLDEWSSFLDVHSSHEPKDDPSDTRPESPVHDMSKSRYHLLAYILSATFKDCSIIVRAKGDNVKNARVTVIDLDSKSLKRMERWEKLDRDVIKCTLDAEKDLQESEKRVCVEDPVRLRNIF